MPMASSLKQTFLPLGMCPKAWRRSHAERVCMAPLSPLPSSPVPPCEYALLQMSLRRGREREKEADRSEESEGGRRIKKQQAHKRTTQLPQIT